MSNTPQWLKAERRNTFRPVLKLAAIVAASICAAAAYVYSGTLEVGADVPHARATYWLASVVRDRAIEVKSQGIVVPTDLSNPDRILRGAGQYASMCSSCHLAPGYNSNETWQGLYPQPPRLALGTGLSAAQIYWVVKHGLKMSGMPAWGKTHDEGELWDIAAFVLQLPKLGPQQYKDIVAKAPMDPDMAMMPMPQGPSQGPSQGDHDLPTS